MLSNVGVDGVTRMVRSRCQFLVCVFVFLVPGSEDDTWCPPKERMKGSTKGREGKRKRGRERGRKERRKRKRERRKEGRKGGERQRKDEGGGKKRKRERKERFLKCRRGGEAEHAERKSLGESVFKDLEAWKSGLP